MKNLIVIPARYNSSRLPGKILKDLNGKSVIQRVYEATQKSKKTDNIIIAADEEITFVECKKFTNNVVMTSNLHNSGTSRIIEISEIYKEYDNIVNVQGDEPLIDSDLIDSIFQKLEENHQIVSAYHYIDKETAQDINNVKVVINEKSDAIYFSRSLIPFDRDENNKNLKYKQHIGIYGYKRDFLIKLKNMPDTSLENIEKLEQLKIIYNGYKINMIESLNAPIGIDTKADYDKVLEIFKNK